jgi:SAM-dependent methyltransferase
VTVAAVGVSPDWLALREPADAAARAGDLVDEFVRQLAAGPGLLIHDLGCGTGSMARWLAPRLPGPQHWVMHDRDADLLGRAAAGTPGTASDGSAVTVETRRGDITRLTGQDVAGASLITTSAVLDMLTADELGRIVAMCVDADCPALLTLSVIGGVELAPPDPLDATIADAFNAHQRRTVEGHQLLGPDAVAVAAQLFTAAGVDVLMRPSPWRLDAPDAALTAEWLTGWVGAACEQHLELTAAARAYKQRRRAELAAGRLRVTVQHRDLLALP